MNLRNKRSLRVKALASKEYVDEGKDFYLLRVSLQFVVRKVDGRVPYTKSQLVCKSLN